METIGIMETEGRIETAGSRETLEGIETEGSMEIWTKLGRKQERQKQESR